MFLCNYFKRNRHRTDIHENIITNLTELEPEPEPDLQTHTHTHTQTHTHTHTHTQTHTQTGDNTEEEIEQPIVLEYTSSTPEEKKEEPERKEKYITFNVEKDFLNNDCIICLSEIILNECVIMIDCGHKYHKECALKWFDKNKICPECDFKL